MAVDERQRRALHGKLETALGTEEAATMMDLLPRSGWDDVVRTRDLDQLRTELRADMTELRGELHRDIAALHSMIARLTWTMTIGVIGAVIAAAGLAFTAATLV